ncbi:formimidoylglutamase [Escherichia marmotae]|uniref:formimidoylglutamase n=1 Tax=Escherichia marmotae TaxID=1499973 RepID=UPI002812E32A|nr:formimidoylglutamase [Escherichia marmotae]MDQ9240600.1 formimidoylglutamase [Escherichia marmotae]MDQ9274365.1 formimidoylglutamase [Escherichia marmotae]
MKQTFLPWSGRVDSQETGVSTRWHQHVQPFSEQSLGGCTLIGFAVDDGVQRNGGRTGAAGGPGALRSILGNMPVLNEDAIFDMGDVQSEEQALESAQNCLATNVATVIARNSFPLVLGGGHEVAWGTFQGIMQSRPDIQRLLIINLDAHFDLRMAEKANSGTPFRQMQEWNTQHGKPFSYRVLGISRFANTQALFDRADSLGVRYWLDESLQFESDLHEVINVLSADIQACDAIYLTICLDVLPGYQAPGVSAPSPLGVPLNITEAIVNLIAGSEKLIAADIAELNPELDRDNLTAKVAARLVTSIVRRGKKIRQIKTLSQ